MIRTTCGALLGVAALVAACGEDPVISSSADTLLSGKVRSAEGGAIEGASLSIRYQLSDTLEAPAEQPDGAARMWLAATADSVLSLAGRQAGLAIELDWAVDSLGQIDTFHVKRSIPASDTFETLLRLPTAAPDTAYSYTDSIPIVAGTFRYRFFAELPGPGLSGDSLSLAVPFHTQLGVPAPNPMVDSMSVPLAIVGAASYSAEMQSTGGDLLATLGSGEADAGELLHFHWSGRDTLDGRAAGGVHRLQIELSPELGDPSALRSPIFLNEGNDATTDSLGNYDIQRLATGVVIRVVDSSAAITGSQEVLQTIELIASAPGYQSQTKELTVLPNVNNKVDFNLDPQ